MSSHFPDIDENKPITRVSPSSRRPPSGNSWGLPENQMPRPPSNLGRNQVASRGNIKIMPSGALEKLPIEETQQQQGNRQRGGGFAQVGSGLVMPSQNQEKPLGPSMSPSLNQIAKPPSRRDLANQIYKELLQEGISLEKTENPVFSSPKGLGAQLKRRPTSRAGADSDADIVTSMAARLQFLEKENQNNRLLLQEFKAKNVKHEEELKFLKEANAAPQGAITNLKVKGNARFV